MSHLFSVTRLSPPAGPRPTWSIAVFARNEARRIRQALESTVIAAAGYPLEIVVLANGCTDGTASEVRSCAATIPDVTLVEIPMADKAHAWNVAMHEWRDTLEYSLLDVQFFMDGDVRLLPDALPRLASAFAAAPTVKAVGGMPATGRNREAWRARMTRYGSIAGNLYALRGSFVREVRSRGLRIPVGLIGEDGFLSWLVENQLGDGPPPARAPQMVFHVEAEFEFDSLSLLKPSDYRTYLRRKWRYALRGAQIEMLIPLLRQRGMGALPAHVDQLYRTGPIPSRLRWIGRDSLWRTLAVQWVRLTRREQTPG
jgi:glycosyltransferase involved in cell wall biosynthesis